MKINEIKQRFQPWAPKLVYLALFLLPWQTRWIIQRPQINGAPWEYGTLSVYVVEGLVLLAAVLLGRPVVSSKLHDVLRSSFVFLGGVYVISAFSISSTLSLFGLLHMTVAVVLFMVLLDERVEVKVAMKAFVYGLLPAALLGWWQVLVGASPAASWLGLAGKSAEVLGVSVVQVGGERMLRAYGPLPHPNIFGGLLAAGLIFIGWLVMKKPLSWKNPVIWIGAGLSATLIVTFSRSAWLAAVAGFAILLFFGWGYFKKDERKRLVKIGGIFILTAFLTTGVFAEQFMTRVNPQTRIETQSIAERGGQLTEAREIIEQYLFTGTGIGAYTAALWKIEPSYPAYIYQPIHNVFLLTLAEIGLFGMVLALRLLWSIGALAKEAVNKNTIFAAALVILWTALGVFDHYLWSQWVGLALSSVILAVICRQQVLFEKSKPANA